MEDYSIQFNSKKSPNSLLLVRIMYNCLYIKLGSKSLWHRDLMIFLQIKIGEGLDVCIVASWKKSYLYLFQWLKKFVRVDFELKKTLIKLYISSSLKGKWWRTRRKINAKKRTPVRLWNGRSVAWFFLHKQCQSFALLPRPTFMLKQKNIQTFIILFVILIPNFVLKKNPGSRTSLTKILSC